MHKIQLPILNFHVEPYFILHYVSTSVLYLSNIATKYHFVDLPAPTNVRATVLSHSSVEITWDQLSDATAYTISYTTAASHISMSVTVKGSSTTSHVLKNLEGDTPYIITVQATTSDSKKSALSTEVSIRTSKS